MKQAQLKSIIVFIVMCTFLLGIAYGFSVISLWYPSSEWVLSNSVPFNFSANTSSTTIPYCALYANNSGTMALKANYTDITNATKHVSGVAI